MEYFLIAICVLGIIGSEGLNPALWFILIFVTHFAIKYW
jgi:hypothetical protein